MQMDKLYVVRYALSNGYVIATYSFWHRMEMIRKMIDESEFDYKLIENNEIHEIWEGR